MKAPTWLLLAFPHRFAHAQGEAWRSTVEEMWTQAAALGPKAQLQTLGRPVLDCLVSAPTAHLAALREVIAGPVPAMALAGASGRARPAWGRQPGWRVRARLSGKDPPGFRAHRAP